MKYLSLIALLLWTSSVPAQFAPSTAAPPSVDARLVES